MKADAAPVAFRCDEIELIQQGENTTIRVLPARAGAVLRVSEASVTLYDATGRALITDAAATITDGVATYVVTSATTAGSSRGEGWLVVWNLTLEGETEPRIWRHAAALVRTRLYPSIDDADLYRRVPRMNPNQGTGKRTFHPYTTFTSFLDEAWVMVSDRLNRNDRRADLILSPDALREAHLTLTLSLIFADLASDSNATYYERSKDYRADYEAAFSSIRLVYDESDAGVGNTDPRTPGTTTFFFGGGE